MPKPAHRTLTKRHAIPLGTRIEVIIEQTEDALHRARAIPTLTTRLRATKATLARNAATENIERALAHLNAALGNLRTMT